MSTSQPLTSPLQPKRPVPSHQNLQTAAEWFALLRDGQASEQVRADWQAWLDQCDEHREAWHYVEMVTHRFETLQTVTERKAAASVLGEIRDRRVSRRRALAGLAALAGTGLLAWAGYRHTPLGALTMAWHADYYTPTGEIRDLTLEDGSRLWLNTASAVNADFGPKLRRLRLLAGEILIQTAVDADRPFLVDTPKGRLHALGTRFTVRQQDGAMLLAVYQGAVKVHPAAARVTQVVDAGRQVAFTDDDIAAPQPADRAREAWANGVLLAEDITLGELVSELARYQWGHLSVAPEVAGLRVLGGYPLRDPDRVLTMLEEILPVTVRRPLPWWTSIEPTHGESGTR